MIIFTQHLKKFINAEKSLRCGAVHYRGHRVYAINGASMIWATHNTGIYEMIDCATGAQLQQEKIEVEKLIPAINSDSIAVDIETAQIVEMIRVLRGMLKLVGADAHCAIVWNKTKGLYILTKNPPLEVLVYRLLNTEIRMTKECIFDTYDIKKLINILDYIKQRNEPTTLYAPQKERSPLFIQTERGGAILAPKRVSDDYISILP